MSDNAQSSPSVRSFRNNPRDFSAEAIGGTVAAHPDAEWNPAGFIHLSSPVVTEDGEPAVAVVSGGGSGHEPMHSGFIGRGMLAAACPGYLFTSPNAVQIAEATKWADQGRGVLHVVKNYTGDVMNFSVARRMNPDVETATVVVGEDIATERGDEDGPGRRGTAATILVEKVAGAAARRGDGLEQVRKKAQWVADNSRSMAVALAPGYLPTSGRDTFDLDSGEMEVGVGIHGERGVAREKIKPARDIVEAILPDIAEALGLAEGDEVVCLTNGLGGTTLLEIHLVFGEVLTWLAERGITVRRSLNGTFVTSVNMHGVSVTLARCNDEIAELLDAPTAAPAWPGAIGTKAEFAPAKMTFADKLPEAGENNAWLTGFIERAQAGVDDLTELDRIAGDGDFGANIDAAFGDIELPLRGSDGDILDGLAHRCLVRSGGTSGAVFGTLFTELAHAVEDRLTAETLKDGLNSAYEAIHELGGAKYGDKTVVDALYPAARALDNVAPDTPLEDVMAVARDAAVEGVRNTRELSAKKGRASYLGESARDLPDPGAIVVTWLLGGEDRVEDFR
ncbi:PTS-dependent dihydroxyacetone kinase, dihydroxyacetone-binding subunit DhaK [Corynebacterium capitovis DSM 44611]|uniref:dihydroxyacetone kinase family protein n=1 Tax=Corynebacterium capitovis TaxID=131081 RepID=UPI00036D24A2|nr:dihydroxyacetone kinase family protein [Corynebacterium capitovis]WKD58371.1 PTS-dependent dihydroxyacetone kinase, dihydroxyacetone-binding subunit DhaK [Corynebacterium capitovis DSM 44611]